MVSKTFPVRPLHADTRHFGLPKPTLRILKNPPEYHSNLFGNVATDGRRGFTLRVLATGPEADGEPPITYQWFHQGIPIPGQTASRMAAQRTGGRYHVDVMQGESRIRSQWVNFVPGGNL